MKHNKWKALIAVLFVVSIIGAPILVAVTRNTPVQISPIEVALGDAQVRETLTHWEIRGQSELFHECYPVTWNVYVMEGHHREFAQNDQFPLLVDYEGVEHGNYPNGIPGAVYFGAMNATAFTVLIIPEGFAETMNTSPTGQRTNIFVNNNC